MVYFNHSGDSMRINRNRQFSSRDVDNDEVPSMHCAADMHCGGWWYSSCTYANPNGVYYPSSSVTPGSCDGLSWYNWKGFNYSLKSTVLRIQKN